MKAIAVQDHGAGSAADAGRRLSDLCRTQDHRLDAGAHRPQPRGLPGPAAADRRRSEALDEGNHQATNHVFIMLRGSCA